MYYVTNPGYSPTGWFSFLERFKDYWLDFWISRQICEIWVILTGYYLNNLNNSLLTHALLALVTQYAPRGHLQVGVL